MQYKLNSKTSEGFTAIRGSCALSVTDIEKQAQHLRSWAVIRGARIAGGPFLRLLGDGDACVAELPTEGIVVPDAETGLTVDTTDEGPAIEVAGVAFDDMRAVVRALRQQFGSECGLTGVADYHASPDNWATGTLSWHVRTLPAQLPAIIDVEIEAPTQAPAAVATKDESTALAGRRFSIHWPRWRRQDS